MKMAMFQNEVAPGPVLYMIESTVAGEVIVE